MLFYVFGAITIYSIISLIIFFVSLYRNDIRTQEDFEDFCFYDNTDLVTDLVLISIFWIICVPTWLAFEFVLKVLSKLYLKIIAPKVLKPKINNETNNLCSSLFESPKVLKQKNNNEANNLCSSLFKE